MTIQLYLCEDNAIFARDLIEKLPRMVDVRFCGHAECAEAALADPALDGADVLLLDLEMPGNGGLWCIEQLSLRESYPEILVLTTTSSEDVVFLAIQKGAAGYLLKGTALKKVYQGIVDVSEGGCVIDSQLAARFWNLFLSARGRSGPNYELNPEEIDLLNLMARGLSNPELGSAMGRKRTNIKKMLARIYRKMSVNSRVEAVRLAMQAGLVEL
ncbi:response regulator transcription factor [Myxococcota bacterium]|nr:response regulator transcription factor [Myxococcota bacterium]